MLQFSHFVLLTDKVIDKVGLKIFTLEVGASCSDIVAFLCLHFPYFTDNYLECKVRLDHRQIKNNSRL